MTPGIYLRALFNAFVRFSGTSAGRNLSEVDHASCSYGCIEVKQAIRPQVLIHSGNNFDFVNLEENTFSIEDIAHGLSNVCRFGGQCDRFYSVAQHSVLVSTLVPRDLALAALLHDAAEAFMGDITSPLKSLLPDYRALERSVETMILSRFGIKGPLDPKIKHADMIALATEERDLMPNHTDQWEILRGVHPLPYRIKPQSPAKAYRHFMARFNDLN